MVSVIGLAVIVNAGVIGARTPRAAQPARPAPDRGTAERTYPVPMSLVQEHALFITELYAAAWREHHQDYAFLAMRIRRHNQMEEEINYPAALMVGEALKLRFPTATARSES